MKIKEIDRTANVAWSPAEVDPVYLAVGTAAQQLDASLNTKSTLEIYQFDITEGGLDLPVKATLPCESRFHKLIWGSNGITGEKEHPSGIIVGGCDNGVMQVYDASKILKNESPLVLTKSKHTGAVRALDFNPFRSHLVASGASESEIFIWDLTNPKTPMTPGTKVQPADDVSHLAWNKQVEHILASTFSTRCVVWDLRKNEPVIKVSDTTSRIRYKVVEWHPEVATQMCLASEDDSSPVIQLWDLRYATSPLKVIQGHQRGILGMAWCPQDPDLLLTCGKDARILCWNPNYPHPGYEMLCDIPTSSQFSFDVSFCPKNPIVIASSSYDGRVSIFGLSGGAPVTSSKLADSFPGMDLSMSHTPLPSQQPALLQLRDAPKWLKRPCGASFAFGGKLISFHNVKSQGQTQVLTGVVEISQLVTLPTLVERSKKLEETLQLGSLESYCGQKACEAGDSNESRIWEFMQASFSQNPRQLYVSMLGFNTAEMLAKLDSFSTDNDVEELADELQSLGRGAPDGYENGFDIPNLSSTKKSKPEAELLVPTNDSSVDGKINQALLCGSIEVAVNLCLEDERWADALLLASKASPELLIKAQNKYFQKNQNEATQLIRAVVSHDLSHLVERCKLESWKQVLAVILTYADPNEYSVLADELGERLQGSGNDKFKLGALLCCICSGNMNHLVDAWVGDTNKESESDSPEELQDLVEQIMILKKAGEHWGRETNIGGGKVASKLVQYSSLLASQGCLEAALNFLGDSNDSTISSLRERLYYSLRYTVPAKSQINPRSRQSSESSSGMRSNLIKRPSYPTASSSLKRGSSDFMNSTDFSNLTGPVHPPVATPYGSAVPQQNPYGNVYVNSNTNNPGGQYSPSSGLLSYAPVGLPPRPPSTTPASIYNPADVPVNSNRPSAAGDSPTIRTPLGSSLPQPPVSSAAHGWNDPPPIKSFNKPKASASATNSMQPINYPIFTPEAVNSNSMAFGPPRPMDPYGANNMYSGQNNQPPQPMMPPPPMQSSQPFYNTSISTPSYGQQPPPSNSLPSMPPQNSYGPSPTSNSYYAAPTSSGSNPQPFNQPYPSPGVSPMTQSPWGQPSVAPSYQQQTFAPPPVATPQNPVVPLVAGAPMQQPVNILNDSWAQGTTSPPFAPNPASVFQPIVPAATQQLQNNPLKAEPEPPKPKGPIPSEHVELIKTLEKLRSECYEVAHLQQMKRKLEDVARKLEIFSDKLRDGSLTESTLKALHNLVEAVSGHEYNQALSIHTQLVTAGNFAEISAFLPAVKVLIQSAIQLGV